jgi:hypothetical protein
MSFWSRLWGSAPELSFSEFGFLWEAYKASKAGEQEVFADTPSQKRLVELGLINIVSVRQPNPFGIPSPMGDVTFTFAEITPLGSKVLLESVRKEEGEEAAKAMEAWQPPGSPSSADRK